MSLFNKLGNAMLNRLAPEASATAGWSACTSCGEWLARYESRCAGSSLYARCCSPYNCSEWFYCGPQCA
ncbi:MULTISPECIES: hypothetical protein [Streptomyces]|uniref:Uncharacterized protein n=1 Tax=Streptomyces solicathayae TaxID=3081768 RepID=A0ABZ0LM63_9ACTN|nr:hypothetical protein [Streptomyces sp. HUAS YS2]WOX20301.1 hypothetical protein R2D22_02405 [Streptomyces sp. HUAS YS2]